MSNRLVLAVAPVLIVLAAPATAFAATSFLQDRYYRLVPDASSLPRTAAAKVLTYGGSTSQQGPVVFQLSRDRRRIVETGIHWHAKCDSGTAISYGTTFVRGAVPVSPAGNFEAASTHTVDAMSSIATITEEYRGRLGGKSGSGTWHSHAVMVDKASGEKVDDCDTGTLKWSTPGPQNLVYAGRTSTGEPLVVRLRANRREVAHLWIGWGVRCSPSDTFYAFADHFTRLAIVGRGAFGGVFPYTDRADGGGTENYEYVIAGRIGAARATGTFKASVTFKDASGRTTDTCPGSKVRWTARQ